MKINKRLLISIPVFCCLTFIVGCNKAKYYKITEEEEKAWAIYDLKETFKFISTQGDLRSYYIDGKYKAYNNSSSNSYEEYLYTTIYLQEDSDNYYPDGPLGLFLDKNAEGLSVRISLPHFYDNVRIDKQTPTMQTINGKTYPDVYTVVSAPFSLDSVNYIDSIFYSQAYGFLKYVDMYGETYVRTQ